MVSALSTTIVVYVLAYTFCLIHVNVLKLFVETLNRVLLCYSAFCIRNVHLPNLLYNRGRLQVDILNSFWELSGIIEPSKIQQNINILRDEWRKQTPKKLKWIYLPPLRISRGCWTHFKEITVTKMKKKL